jgi:UDP:flavonoid glycosyltransferase YjiC (YdhE family)
MLVGLSLAGRNRFAMRVVIVALGSAGDVHPKVGLSLALKRRGHDVLLVAATVFEPLARRVGLEFCGLGTEKDFHDSVRDPDIWSPHRALSVIARRLIIPAMREVYELIEKEDRRGRIVVAASGLTFGARCAQEKLQVPLATVHLQPSIFRSVHEPAVLSYPDILGALPRGLRPWFYRAADRFFIDPLLVGPLNEFRREVGLAPVRRLFDRWMHSPQLVIGLFPEWFAAPQPDWPPNTCLTGFPLYDESGARATPAELAAFLAAGPAPVVFAAGSANAQARDFFETCAEVCRRAGWRGILLSQFPDQVPASLPDGVHHFTYVPFSQVLPRAAALVHHGGIGTTAQAFAAGVPQLVRPLAHDQPDNAARVRRLGAGEFLRPHQYKTGRVLETLGRLMKSEEIRRNCQRLKSNLSVLHALERTCELIEQLGK